MKVTTAGYPHGHSSSGIYLKFMPYKPTMNVRGMNIVAMTVSTSITSLSLMLTLGGNYLDEKLFRFELCQAKESIAAGCRGGNGAEETRPTYTNTTVS